MKNKRLPVKRIGRLIALSLRTKEKGRAIFQKSGNYLARARELGLDESVSIVLPDGRTFRIKDRFADTDHAYSPARVERFVLEEVKPLPVRPAKVKREGGDE